MPGSARPRDGWRGDRTVGRGLRRRARRDTRSVTPRPVPPRRGCARRHRGRFARSRPSGPSRGPGSRRLRFRSRRSRATRDRAHRRGRHRQRSAIRRGRAVRGCGPGSGHRGRPPATRARAARRRSPSLRSRRPSRDHHHEILTARERRIVDFVRVRRQPVEPFQRTSADRHVRRGDQRDPEADTASIWRRGVRRCGQWPRHR